jgi:Stage II sporulation protein E (SpoIIE)
MVGIETEKVFATSSLGLPESTAESTLNLRSFEYGFMPGGYHIMDQSLRVPLYVRRGGDADELMARGMPLGLMPGMGYEEKEINLGAGDGALFYSDGLVEAHNPEGEMFGFPRLQALVAEHAGGVPLVDFLMDELYSFTGERWEQEDDITLVTLHRAAP